MSIINNPDYWGALGIIAIIVVAAYFSGKKNEPGNIKPPKTGKPKHRRRKR